MALFEQIDDPLGGDTVVPTEVLDPMAGLDLPEAQLGPPLMAPMPPSLQQPGWQAGLMTLIPALLAAIAGPKRALGRGLAAGAAQVPQQALQMARFRQMQQYQDELSRHRAAQQTYQQAQFQARQVAEQRRRDAMAQRALTSVGEQVEKLETREDYNRNMERFGATFAASGYPRLGSEQLRRMFPYRPPNVAKLAEKALKKYYDNPMVMRRLATDGPTALILDNITIGEGSDLETAATAIGRPELQRVDLLEAHRLAGMDLKISKNHTIPLEDLQQWPGAVISAKQQFFEQYGEQPTEKDNPAVFEMARTLAQNKNEADAEINSRLKQLQVQNAELGVQQKQLALAQKSGTGPTLSNAQQLNANRLADDYARDSKDFQQRAQSYGTVSAAAKDPSAAGDLSLIFAYMKMLDPGSVVREGEFATAQNTAGVPDRIRNVYNRAMSGERLTTRQRADFTNQARAIYSSAKQRQDAIVRAYTQRASRAGVPADMVILDYSQGVEGAPAVGGAGGWTDIGNGVRVRKKQQ